ncbi:MAG: hypothetical protein K2M86_06740, partial [Odoribacter sp.]|nr:hypothetical protein [Odoribacter sp.]
MNRVVLLVCCLFCFQYLAAQTLPINGSVIVNGSSSEGAKIILHKNGKKQEEILINRRGRFDLKLALGADYKMTFSKEGYIPKIVDINTDVPEESIETNPDFPPVKLIINLFPYMENVDLSIFEQPIAILTYNPELDDFAFDREYAEKIKGRVGQTEQKLKRLLATQGAAAAEKERQFATWAEKGQQAFENEEVENAIQCWEEALKIKPEKKELRQQIDIAQKEIEQEAARKAAELENERAYALLLANADSLFQAGQYKSAKETYRKATQLKEKEVYPIEKIKEIDTILAALTKQELARQQQEEEKNIAYQKALAMANQAFAAKEYAQAIHAGRQALNLKAHETEPKEIIAKARQALAEQKKQEELEAEQRRLEQERINELRNKYNSLIAQADLAFRMETYALAKIYYANADRLQLNEPYPKEQIDKIDKIINSSQYQTKLAAYNKNKAYGEHCMQQKNYAGAKVYFQKALSILPVDKEEIEQKITEIDRFIEEARLAEIERAYKEN